MTLSNLDERKLKYRDRWIRLEQEKRARAEDQKDLHCEMKNSGLESLEIAGIKLAARRYLEAEAKKSKRKAIEQLALVFDDVPLSAERAGA